MKKFILLSSLVAPTIGFASVECEATKIICKEDTTIGELKRCLRDKRDKIKKCTDGLGSLLDSDKQRIKEIIDEKAAPVVGQLDKDLTKIAEILIGVDRVNSDNKTMLEELSRRFSGYVKSYTDATKPLLSAYKTNQLKFAASLEEYRGLTAEQRITKYTELQLDMQSEFSDIHAQVSSVLHALAIVKHNIEFFTSRYMEGIESYRSYLESNGLSNLIFSTTDMQNSLNTMRGELESWLVSASTQNQRNDKLVSQLLRASVKEKSDSISGPVLEKYYRNLAAVDFLAKAAHQIELGFITYSNEMTESGIPLTHNRVVAIKNFLEFTKVCSTTPRPEWMGSGCLNLERKTSQAETYLRNVGSEIKGNLQFMKDYIAAEDLSKVDAASSALKRNDLTSATLIYDEIARGISL